MSGESLVDRLRVAGLSMLYGCDTLQGFVDYLVYKGFKEIHSELAFCLEHSIDNREHPFDEFKEIDNIRTHLYQYLPAMIAQSKYTDKLFKPNKNTPDPVAMGFIENIALPMVFEISSKRPHVLDAGIKILKDSFLSQSSTSYWDIPSITSKTTRWIAELLQSDTVPLETKNSLVGLFITIILSTCHSEDLILMYTTCRKLELKIDPEEVAPLLQKLEAAISEPMLQLSLNPHKTMMIIPQVQLGRETVEFRRIAAHKGYVYVTNEDGYLYKVGLGALGSTFGSVEAETKLPDKVLVNMIIRQEALLIEFQDQEEYYFYDLRDLSLIRTLDIPPLLRKTVLTPNYSISNTFRKLGEDFNVIEEKAIELSFYYSHAFEIEDTIFIVGKDGRVYYLSFEEGSIMCYPHKLFNSGYVTFDPHADLFIEWPILDHAYITSMNQCFHLSKPFRHAQMPETFPSNVLHQYAKLAAANFPVTNLILRSDFVITQPVPISTLIDFASLDPLPVLKLLEIYITMFPNSYSIRFNSLYSLVQALRKKTLPLIKAVLNAKPGTVTSEEEASKLLSALPMNSVIELFSDTFYNNSKLLKTVYKAYPNPLHEYVTANMSECLPFIVSSANAYAAAIILKRYDVMPLISPILSLISEYEAHDIPVMLRPLLPNLDHALQNRNIAKLIIPSLLKITNSLSAARNLQNDVAEYAANHLKIRLDKNTSTIEKIVESAHPYAHGVDSVTRVVIPGAKELTITFDERSATESGPDYLSIFEVVDGEQVPVEPAKISGPPENWRRTIKVRGSEAVFCFKSDLSINDWGYKAYVKGLIFMSEQFRSLPAITEVARALFVSCLSVAPTVDDNETLSSLGRILFSLNLGAPPREMQYMFAALRGTEAGLARARECIQKSADKDPGRGLGHLQTAALLAGNELEEEILSSMEPLFGTILVGIRGAHSNLIEDMMSLIRSLPNQHKAHKIIVEIMEKFCYPVYNESLEGFGITSILQCALSLVHEGMTDDLAGRVLTLSLLSDNGVLSVPISKAVRGVIKTLTPKMVATILNIIGKSMNINISSLRWLSYTREPYAKMVALRQSVTVKTLEEASKLVNSDGKLGLLVTLSARQFPLFIGQEVVFPSNEHGRVLTITPLTITIELDNGLTIFEPLLELETFSQVKYSFTPIIPPCIEFTPVLVDFVKDNMGCSAFWGAIALSEAAISSSQLISKPIELHPHTNPVVDNEGYIVLKDCEVPQEIPGFVVYEYHGPKKSLLINLTDNMSVGIKECGDTSLESLYAFFTNSDGTVRFKKPYDLTQTLPLPFKNPFSLAIGNAGQLLVGCGDKVYTPVMAPLGNYTFVVISGTNYPEMFSSTLFPSCFFVPSPKRFTHYIRDFKVKRLQNWYENVEGTSTTFSLLPALTPHNAQDFSFEFQVDNAVIQLYLEEAGSMSNSVSVGSFPVHSHISGVYVSFSKGFIAFSADGKVVEVISISVDAPVSLRVTVLKATTFSINFNSDRFCLTDLFKNIKPPEMKYAVSKARTFTRQINDMPEEDPSYSVTWLNPSIVVKDRFLLRFDLLSPSIEDINGLPANTKYTPYLALSTLIQQDQRKRRYVLDHSIPPFIGKVYDVDQLTPYLVPVYERLQYVDSKIFEAKMLYNASHALQSSPVASIEVIMKAIEFSQAPSLLVSKAFQNNTLASALWTQVIRLLSHLPTEIYVSPNQSDKDSYNYLFTSPDAHSISITAPLEHSIQIFNEEGKLVDIAPGETKTVMRDRVAILSTSNHLIGIRVFKRKMYPRFISYLLSSAPELPGTDFIKKLIDLTLETRHMPFVECISGFITTITHRILLEDLSPIDFDVIGRIRSKSLAEALWLFQIKILSSMPNPRKRIAEFVEHYYTRFPNSPSEAISYKFSLSLITKTLGLKEVDDLCPIITYHAINAYNISRIHKVTPSVYDSDSMVIKVDASPSQRCLAEFVPKRETCCWSINGQNVTSPYVTLDCKSTISITGCLCSIYQEVTKPPSLATSWKIENIVDSILRTLPQSIIDQCEVYAQRIIHEGMLILPRLTKEKLQKAFPGIPSSVTRFLISMHFLTLLAVTSPQSVQKVSVVSTGPNSLFDEILRLSALIPGTLSLNLAEINTFVPPSLFSLHESSDQHLMYPRVNAVKPVDLRQYYAFGVILSEALITKPQAFEQLPREILMYVIKGEESSDDKSSLKPFINQLRAMRAGFIRGFRGNTVEYISSITRETQ